MLRFLASCKGLSVRFKGSYLLMIMTLLSRAPGRSASELCQQRRPGGGGGGEDARAKALLPQEPHCLCPYSTLRIIIHSLLATHHTIRITYNSLLTPLAPIHHAYPHLSSLFNRHSWLTNHFNRRPSRSNLSGGELPPTTPSKDVCAASIIAPPYTVPAHPDPP